MSWTTPADLRGQVQRLWDRGLVLASLAGGEPLFPRRLILKRPGSGELAERFDEVRTWVAELRRMPHCRVVMREVRHRVLGTNLVPDEVWIDTLDDALALLGKRAEAKRFAALLATTRERQPAAVAWLARNPHEASRQSAQWPHLLDIVDWLQAHPRPAIHVRQLDIAGVHTKFIEANRTVLSQLLDLALPEAAIDAEAGGSSSASRFCRRYGFLDKPLRIRFRVLDHALALLPLGADHEQDITLSADAFARLELPVEQVFVTENEVNFLAFPERPGSIVIFGAGYGFDTLAQAGWLRNRSIHYWGDIDTHGFAILDQLRAHFPQARSFLMDRETLMSHAAQWVSELDPVRRDLPRLDHEERELFDDLRDNRLGAGVRLEQERIGFRWVEKALQRLPGQRVVRVDRA